VNHGEKMAARKSEKTGKRYQLQFSLLSLLFWCLGLFILLAWTFVLGILVGRGFLPEGVKNLSELKSPIGKLQDMVKKKQSDDLELLKKLDKEPKFAFYEELSTKKERKASEKEKSKNTPKPDEGSENEKAPRPREKPRPARVKEEAKEAEKETAPAGLPAKEQKWEQKGGQYTLQLASLEREIDAVKMINRLTAKGYPAYYYAVTLEGKTYYRVRCGRFKDAKEAGRFRAEFVQKEKIKPFITKVE